jgi:hypothetical protein
LRALTALAYKAANKYINHLTHFYYYYYYLIEKKTIENKNSNAEKKAMRVNKREKDEEKKELSTLMSLIERAKRRLRGRKYITRN